MGKGETRRRGVSLVDAPRLEAARMALAQARTGLMQARAALQEAQRQERGKTWGVHPTPG